MSSVGNKNAKQSAVKRSCCSYHLRFTIHHLRVNVRPRWRRCRSAGRAANPKAASEPRGLPSWRPRTPERREKPIHSGQKENKPAGFPSPTESVCRQPLLFSLDSPQSFHHLAPGKFRVLVSISCPARSHSLCHSEKPRIVNRKS